MTEKINLTGLTMKNKDLISVIITNYNYGMYVTEAINSVLNQTYPNIELIIINDGSTDNSDGIIKKAIKKDSKRKIVYINRENKGVVYTRNEGIDVAKGKYISYLDADDYFNKDYIEKSYKVAIDSGADVVYPNWHYVGEWMGKPDTNFPEFTLRGLQMQDVHCTPASLVKKSAIGDIRFEAEEVAEDWDFFIGLSLGGAKFKLAKDNRINYRVRSGTRSSQLDPGEDVYIFVNILRKHKKIHGDKVIEPGLIADKINKLRNPRTIDKLFSLYYWKKLANLMKRDGVKNTVVRIGARTISNNQFLWNIISSVRNKKLERSMSIGDVQFSKESKLAVVVHLYYPDRWDKIKENLSRIDVPFDIYVSVQEKDKDVKLSKVNKFHKKTNVVALPNRGRDVLPFITIARKLIDLGQYEYILKLHSKKSPHRGDGDEWVDSLLSQLVPESIDGVLEALSKKDTGIVGPSDHVVSLSRYMGGNRPKMAEIIKSASGIDTAENILKDTDRYPFFGGTMFWSRLDFFEPLLKSSLRPIDFSTERGQVDATTAHALERFFGMSMHEVYNKKMYSIDDSGKTKVVRKKKYTDNYKYAD